MYLHVDEIYTKGWLDVLLKEIRVRCFPITISIYIMFDLKCFLKKITETHHQQRHKFLLQNEILY